MRASASTQCTLEDLQRPEVSAPGPFVGQSTTEVVYLLDLLDFNKPSHLQRLKYWCDIHWPAVIQNSLANSNIIFYHSCCNSFSKRSYSKRTNHPEYLSVSINRMATFKQMKGPEGLYQWLVMVAKSNASLGHRTLFPTINKRYCECFDGRPAAHPDPRRQHFLDKRNRELEEELKEAKLVACRLQVENTILLNSSKSWCTKYQELLEQREIQEEMFATPMKKLSNSPIFFENT